LTSPRNRSAIADFVRDRVRDALNNAEDSDTVNVARAVNIARPGSRTSVESTHYTEIIQRRSDQRSERKETKAWRKRTRP
jgi:hypothetical protein